MRVTPSARIELFGAVVRMQRRDPEAAARFVYEVEDRLINTAGKVDEVPELGSPKYSATAGSGHRFYLRERTDGVWLIAVWPDAELRRDR